MDKTSRRERTESKLVEFPVAKGAGTRRTAKPKDTGRGIKLDTELQEFIGKELQSIYADVLTQPVPDRFLDLLKKLDAPRTDTKKADE